MRNNVSSSVAFLPSGLSLPHEYHQVQIYGATMVSYIGCYLRASASEEQENPFFSHDPIDSFSNVLGIDG